MTLTSQIPFSKLNQKTVKRNANTQDIIDSVLRMDKKEAGDFNAFAKQFKDGEKGLKELHYFVRNRIKYKADGEQQIIKSPPALWRIGEGDCKSMTLFINRVLQCLDIPYIIRFTTYKAKDKEVKHVYTVAILDGKQIPVDAVYHSYGKEKPYYKKIDYTPDMTDVIEIAGLDFGKAHQAKNKNLPYMCTPVAPPFQDDATIQHQAEVNQKKKNVQKMDDVQFHRVTEGEAMLELSLQELHTMKAMQPESEHIAQDGINRIVKALNGKHLSALSGVIPPELYGLAEKIKMAPNLTMAANGHGYTGQQLEYLLQASQEDGEKWTEEKEKRLQESKRIGAISWPERICMGGLWFMESGPYQYNDLIGLEGWDYPNNPGRCGTLDLRAIANSPLGSPGLDPAKIFYNYGKMSEYRVNIKEFGNVFMDTLTAMNGDLLGGIGGNGGGPASVWVSNGLDWAAIQDIMGQNSGATTKYINDIYNPTNIDGTMGSGLFYTFADAVTTPGGNPVIANKLPGSVIQKKGFQDQFNHSVNIFTGVSPGNVKAMARNGVIFDTGKQPEATLNELYSLYITPTDVINGYKYIAGIGYVPVVEIIAAIAVALVTIIGALASAGVFSDKAQSQAPLIDSSASDNAQWRPLSPSTLANGSDWEGGPNTGSDKGGGLADNKALLFGGAALLAYVALNDDK